MDQNNSQNNQQAQPAQQPQQPQPGKGAATASLVLGILSILFGGIFGWAFYTAILGVITGVAGIVLSIAAKRRGLPEACRLPGS